MAGADILLHPENPEGTVREVMEGLASKQVTEEQIDAALQRIMKAKKRFQKSVRREIDYEHHKALASRHYRDVHKPCSKESRTAAGCRSRYGADDFCRRP